MIFSVSLTCRRLGRPISASSTSQHRSYHSGEYRKSVSEFAFVRRASANKIEFASFNESHASIEQERKGHTVDSRVAMFLAVFNQSDAGKCGPVREMELLRLRVYRCRLNMWDERRGEANAQMSTYQIT